MSIIVELIEEKNRMGLHKVRAMKNQFFGTNTEESIRTDIDIIFPHDLRRDQSVGKQYIVSDLYLKHTASGKPYYDIPKLDIKHLIEKYNYEKLKIN